MEYDEQIVQIVLLKTQLDSFLKIYKDKLENMYLYDTDLFEARMKRAEEDAKKNKKNELVEFLAYKQVKYEYDIENEIPTKLCKILNKYY